MKATKLFSSLLITILCLSNAFAQDLITAKESIALQKEKMNLASKYYLIALENSQKDEFKAKITYMLAKVELADFDINYAKKDKDYYNEDLDRFDLERYWGYQNEDIYVKYINNKYGKYFDLLKKDYSNTKYYEELIKECSNLRIYQKEK